MLQVLAPVGIDSQTLNNQLSVPSLNRRYREFLPQRPVSLLQCTTITPPCWQKIVFHVKHAPIHELPSALWTPLYQLVDFRIDNLDRKRRDQIGRLTSSLAIDMNILPAPAHLQADTVFLIVIGNLTEKREFFRSGPDKTIRLARPKRSTATE
jgi:hypothetical protein